MQASLILKDVNRGGTLTLTPNGRTFHVRLSEPGVAIDTTAYAFMSESLPDFIAELAKHWNGWAGPKNWGTLEGEVTLEFNHDKVGHVNVRIQLKESSHTRWRYETNFVLEPSSLDGLAVQARQLILSTNTK